MNIWITDFLIKFDNFYSTFLKNLLKIWILKFKKFGKKLLRKLGNNLRTKNCIILTNSDKKSLKILKNTKISTAGNIILAKCGLEFCIEFVQFSFAAAFHIVFFHNLVNLKKHWLSLVENWTFSSLFSRLRKYFFVICNNMRTTLLIIFSLLLTSCTIKKNYLEFNKPFKNYTEDVSPFIP